MFLIKNVFFYKKVSFVSIIGGDVKNENGSIKVPFTVNNNDYQNISDAIKKRDK